MTMQQVLILAALARAREAPSSGPGQVSPPRNGGSLELGEPGYLGVPAAGSTGTQNTLTDEIGIF